MIDDLSRETLTLAFSSPFCMHALLACCGAEIPTQRSDFRQLGQFHYTHAVAGLRERLDKGLSGNQWVVSLLTIMMLCIYERSNPLRSSGVEIHLVGAARIIQLYSCLPHTDFEHSEIEQAMHRLLRESFIFHVATSLPFRGEQSHRNEIEMAFSLAEQALGQHFRPRLIVFPDSPVLGFPPSLFRCIYTIYRVYQDSSHEIPDGETCRKLDRDLHRWYDQIEASLGKSSYEENASGRDTVNVQAICQDQTAPNYLQAAVIGPKLYILGCRILLRRIPGFEAPGTASVLDSMICEGVDIVQRLQPDEDYFADYYCWPLLLIGIHSSDPHHRDVLLSQVLAFWRSTNNGTMRRLANMLDLHWKSYRDPRAIWAGPVP